MKYFPPVSRWLFPVIGLAGAVALAAQTPRFPQREFRGVWVATVNGLDYPSRPSVNPDTLKADFIQILEQCRRLGLNALIVQVRPAGDALYPSAHAPWSAFLTGQQGLAPSGGFDPLAFMIDEAHRRGMEFHAWLNPYRATMNLDTLALSPRHMFYQRRHWMLRYGDRFYFNPASPEVREHLMRVVEEIVRGYDIDAIHFDDYFYPYPIAGLAFPDSTDFLRAGGQGDIGDWRRANVDALIELLAHRIKEIKPHVRFGISPFGVWRNAERDPMGSPTRAGAACYDDLYADVLKWLRLGWIDYVAPQLYWHIGFPVADFQLLLEWWRRHSYQRQLYIGHALYKVGDNAEPAWHDPTEISRQIELLRRDGAAQGSIFFRAGFLARNPLGVSDSLMAFYAAPALPPSLPSIASLPPVAPELLRLRQNRENVLVRWRPAPNPATHYAVYRRVAPRDEMPPGPYRLLGVYPGGVNEEIIVWSDDSAQRRIRYEYRVAALNRFNNEGPPSRERAIRRRGGAASP
jgi:uncharacterized lipoprotein YddW (UPF0748 family)